jgi:hypothetical protein
LASRTTFWIEDQATYEPSSQATLLFFRHGIVQSHLSISHRPVMALSVDAPSGEPKDIAFMTQPVVLWRALTADSHIEATDGMRAKA